MEWQPIETAPRDGTLIDLFFDGLEYNGYEWFENSWCKVSCDQCGPYVVSRISKPTLWKLHEEPPL